ncbi:hypothetical protein ABZ793_29055 [Micromonospora sp. NPDC047465]|uniref:hypothetical protein n=1 Tax=Micromonospora sp. NPDC047465 TaxID=3154813 RepID=UPI00341004D7
MVDTPPTTKVSMSARYPSDIAWRVIDDAEARGVKPGVILRKIVEAHYATLDAASDEPITVRPADISIVGWVGGVLGDATHRTRISGARRTRRPDMTDR